MLSPKGMVNLPEMYFNIGLLPICLLALEDMKLMLI
jgi:hypothetical protein